MLIYKTFVRPDLDYSDILHDQPNNASSHQKPEKIQYNYCLAISGPIRGMWKEKLYQELGIETLFRIFRSKSQGYLYNLIPQIILPYLAINVDTVPL